MKDEDREDVEPTRDCGHEGRYLAECPFAFEIHDVDEPCNCCSDCRHECAMDI
ncbi:MAG: hypothetical protein ACYTAN_18875 [Planctomycetota bacterium]|jgi:hypothetical protein